MAVPSIDQISVDWNSRGFSYDVWVDPPGREWVDFIHAGAVHTARNIGTTTARWLYGYKKI